MITNENDLESAKAELKKYNALRKLKVRSLNFRKVGPQLSQLTDFGRFSNN